MSDAGLGVLNTSFSTLDLMHRSPNSFTHILQTRKANLRGVLELSWEDTEKLGGDDNTSQVDQPRAHDHEFKLLVQKHRVCSHRCGCSSLTFQSRFRKFCNSDLHIFKFVPGVSLFLILLWVRVWPPTPRSKRLLWVIRGPSDVTVSWHWLLSGLISFLIDSLGCHRKSRWGR